MKVVFAILIVLVVAAVIQVRRARRNAARQSRLIERGTDTLVQTRSRRHGLGARAFHLPADRPFIPTSADHDEQPHDRD